MSKGKGARKEEKKKPTKTLKEKRADEKVKKKACVEVYPIAKTIFG